MWTSDFRPDERFTTSLELRAHNAAADIVAGLAAPRHVAGKVTGVRRWATRRHGIFTGREIALVQAFADQTATAPTT